MTLDPANEWWRNWMNVVRLVRFLEAAGHITTARQVVDVIEKPWKFEREYEAMQDWYRQENAA